MVSPRAPDRVMEEVGPGTSLCPTLTRLGDIQTGNAEIGGGTPAPASVITAGEFVALLTTDTLPVKLPATVGVNAGFSEMDWLGFRTLPAGPPLALNPTPVTVTLEIVTFEFPVFVSVVL